MAELRAAVWRWAGTALHLAFGIGLISGVVAVMVARRLPSTRAAIPDIPAIVVTTTIPLMMSVGIWGVLQRAMFPTAAIWCGRDAFLARTPEEETP